jgi:integrase
MKSAKITETVRAARLRRVDGVLVPSVTDDSEVPGFTLHVGSKRAFWAVTYQPRGINPAIGKRWGKVRHEIGDAYTVPLAEARAEARAVKARASLGEDPHKERMASVAASVAARTVLPTTLAEALDAYEKAVMARREPKEATRRQSIHYARKAVRLMKAEKLALTRLDSSVILLMIETAEGSAGERRHVFGALSRFLSWSRRQKLIEHNPCDDIERNERPKPGKARSNVPSIEEIRALWAAAEDEPMRDLVRFMLLVPLRRDEAGGLLWSEVNLDNGRIRIRADRMKKAADHELPLSPQALAILAARAETKAGDLVFPSGVGKAYDGWNRLALRLRKEIGQAKATKDEAFGFHDVRRSFVSHLAGRFDVDLLDQCLSHTRKGVFAVYQRSARWPERVAALNAWAGLVLGVDEPDNVLLFRATR